MTAAAAAAPGCSIVVASASLVSTELPAMTDHQNHYHYQYPFSAAQQTDCW